MGVNLGNRPLIIVSNTRSSFGWLFALLQLLLFALTLGLMALFTFTDLPIRVGVPVTDRSLEEKDFSLGALFTGPLALHESTRSALALSLEQKLCLFAQRRRPDFGGTGEGFSIGVVGAEERRVVEEGKPLFCELELHPSGGVVRVAFTEKDTGVKMVPHVVGGWSLAIEVEREGEETVELLLKPVDQTRSSGPLAPALAELQGASWWGNDLFFSHYGGDEYRQKGMREKLEVGSAFIFVREGDFLTSTEEGWRVLDSLEEARADCPLAHVRKVAADQLEIEAWDEKGVIAMDAQMRRAPALAPKTQPLRLITEPKRRTAKAVSCRLGGQRWILRPGDWLLGTERGWRRLRTSEEIKSYLDHALAGELLVIDSLEKNGLMKGHLFDEKRTSMRPFSIQVAGSFGKAKRGRR